MNIAPNILNAVNEWLTPTFDQETQAAVKELISIKRLKSKTYR